MLDFKMSDMKATLAISEGLQQTWYGLLEDKIFGEERINSYTTGDQSSPDTAVLIGGGYVTTWVSYAQDGSAECIYAQRMDANGVAVGPEFQVNTTIAGTQTDPTIAALSNG